MTAPDADPLLPTKPDTPASHADSTTSVADAAARSPIDVATRAFDAGLVIDASGAGPLATLDLTAGDVRVEVVGATTYLAREPLAAGALGDGCAERRVRGDRDVTAAGRAAERARALREAAALKRELERLDG